MSGINVLNRVVATTVASNDFDCVPNWEALEEVLGEKAERAEKLAWEPGDKPKRKVLSVRRVRRGEMELAERSMLDEE